MAVFTSTTPVWAAKPLPLAALFASSVLARFERLNEALARYVAAERDLQDVDVWDPAFRPWLTASEEAHDAVMDALRDLRDEDPSCPEDGLLQAMGDAVLAYLGAETGAEFHAGQMQVTRSVRSCGLARLGFGSRIPGLIGQVEQYLHELIVLDQCGRDDEFGAFGQDFYAA